MLLLKSHTHPTFILSSFPLCIRYAGDEDEDLAIQLDCFDEQKLQDDDELMALHPNDGIDLNSHSDVFHAIFNKVSCFKVV